MAMSNAQQGFATGAASGAAAGAVGGPVGMVAGAVIGGALGLSGANKADDEMARAKDEARRTRIKSIMKEMGMKNQADNNVMSNFNKGTTSAKQDPSANPGGFIGSNLTTSGTF